MLRIEIARIPPEGQEIDETLDTGVLHLEAEGEFRLLPGARIRGHVELVDGTTVHVRGRLTCAVEPECGRCLERYPAAIDQDLDLFYLPRAAEEPEEEEEVELSDREVVVGYYDREQLDLGEAMREQIYLALPLKRLCRPDCRGLCPTCGRNLNSGSCGCPEPERPEDPRLALLRRLIDDEKN